MITIVEGLPGHGKSYSGIVKIEESIRAGIPVATNFPLREDWSVVLAKRAVAFHRWRKDKLVETAERYARLVHITDDLDELLRVRFAGKGEGRGRVFIDEAHREMNTRSWDQAPGMTRNEAVTSRLKVIAYASAHRHYGVDIWLFTQSAENLDTQIRRLHEFRTVVLNMRRLPVVGLFLRKNLFISKTVWNDRAQTKAGVSIYGLNKSVANLYDTHAMEQYDWPDDAIVLPRASVLAPVVDGEGRGQDANEESARPDPTYPPLGRSDALEEIRTQLGDHKGKERAS